MSQKENDNIAEHLYRASTADFINIPGNPIAYWISKQVRAIFNEEKFGNYFDTEGQNKTTNNEKYLRYLWEVNLNTIGKGKRWIRCAKGGSFRKWEGNIEHLIDWSQETRDFYRKDHSARIIEEKFWFLEGITWTDISSSNTGFRYLEEGCTYETTGPTLFINGMSIYFSLAFLNTPIASSFINILNPTYHVKVKDIRALPIVDGLSDTSHIELISKKLTVISRIDWNSYETSWGFSTLPLLNQENIQLTLNTSYQALRTHWSEITQEMQNLEQENNHIFIDAYGLQDELKPEVSLCEITLTCNPHYRYGGNLTDQQREDRLQSDTIAELISYTIGCMMGRYSIDRKGLVYAHGGNEGFKTLVEEGVYNRFPADSDGILPMTSEAWFEDDIAARVEEFVHIVWGAEHLEDNLQFIAYSLCLAAIKPVKKGGETSRETIRRYLSTQYFKDHLKTYKKRPIYWLFSSGKEKAFECLVYLHRYNEATLPRMRTEYVTPLLGQMDSRIERLRLQQNEAETAEAKRIGKEIDSLTNQLTELRAFDDQLKHYADMKIPLNLDDGVKFNYGKFGTLLAEEKAITGDKT